MNVFASARAHLTLTFALLATAAFGQTEPAQELHQCIKPIPREGQAYERHLLLNQQVKDSQGQAEVIFVGDSITQGWEGNGKEVWAKYYAPRHAIGVNNIPDDNNTPWQVLEGVTAVVQKLREKLPETKVLLLGIFPFREDFCAQRAKALQVNQALHKLDDGQWIRFLDFGYLFLQPNGKISKDIMRDFLHPSAAGYRIWAEAMEPELAAMLGEKPIVP